MSVPNKHLIGPKRGTTSLLVNKSNNYKTN
nr:MAG TPA: hypothetical protein [Caudoviricetes sp.]